MRTALLVIAATLASTFANTFAAAQAADWLYLTVPGDTLSGIGQTYLRNPKDWPKVQSANGVPIPKHLPANSRLKIPVELLKLTPAPVNVVAVNGTPRYKSADGPYQPLKTGASLTGGETVLTGPGASVSYRFADDTRLTQQASSKLSFGRLAGYGKTGMVSTEISLDSGRLEASAAKQLAPAGGFQVHTPVGVAGLRGTGFRLNVADDGRTLRNEVTEGAVAVSAQAQEVRVNAGYGTYAEQGKPPAAPVALLPKPDLSGLPANVTRLPLELSWPASGAANDAARAWRAQLSADADFLTVLRDSVFTQPNAQWEADPVTGDLPDGAYFLRVRGIDNHGLEGFNAQHAFTLNARPLPPTPIAPALGERLSKREVDLAWAAATDAQGYLLQLAPTPEFGQPLIERRLPAITKSSETLAEGDWHWRVASLDAQGQPRAFSPHRAFRVQPPPPKPVLITKPEQGRVASPETTLRWQPSDGALAYRVQVAPTPDFAQPAVDKRVTETQLAARAPAPGIWHWRVSALGMEDVNQGYSESANWRYQPLPKRPEMPLVKEEGGILTVAWQGAAPAYRLEMSANEAFNPLVSTHALTRPEARLVKPAAGNYWLRVISLDADKQESAPSPAAAVVMQPFRPWWLLPLLLFVP
jgi:hypothetical protein